MSESTPGRSLNSGGIRDLTPEENQSLLSEEDKEARAAREAEVTAHWEATLGKWLGGNLAKLILEHVSFEALQGYAKDALEKVSPGLESALKGVTDSKASEAKALQVFSKDLGKIIEDLGTEWIEKDADKNLLAKISTWIEDNPGWTTAILGTAIIGGAVAVWFADPDLDISVPLKMKDWTFTPGIDLGSLRDIAFKGASFGVANKTLGLSFDASYEIDKEVDADGELTKTTQEAKLSSQFGKDKSRHVILILNGKAVDTQDGIVAYTTDGKLEFVDPKTKTKLSLNDKSEWTTEGDSKHNFGFSAETDAGVSGKLDAQGTIITIIDDEGNILTTDSQKVSLAVGREALKFSAAYDRKSENGEVSHAGSAGVSSQGHLSALTTYKASANFEHDGETLRVKAGADLKTKLNGYDLELSSMLGSDGSVTASVKLGKDGTSRTITGKKDGDTYVFDFKDIFDGGSIGTTYTYSDGELQASQTAKVKFGEDDSQSLSTTVGTSGASANWAGAFGSTSLRAGGAIENDAFKKASVGATYTGKHTTAKFDYILSRGEEGLDHDLSASVKTELNDVYSLESALKLHNTQLSSFMLGLGYDNEDQGMKAFLGYRADWVAANKSYNHVFDAKFRYGLGRWMAESQGSVTMAGNNFGGARLDNTALYDVGRGVLVGGGVRTEYDRSRTDRQFNMIPHVDVQIGQGAAKPRFTFSYDPLTKAAVGGMSFSF